MQGRKDWTPKMMYQVHLDDLVPKNNFYRLLERELNLHFLYKATEKYYGDEGQESIDPVVFFKICLVGYLNNINSDRRLIDYCSDSLAIRLYLKYDIDEPLPWHSTISRTRQLYGEEIFLSLFRKVLTMCVEKGMVNGRRQAVDSAFIKANASMNSLIEKEVMDDAAVYVDELNENSEYKVTVQKKKQVEQHHTWKERRTKNHPGHGYKAGKEGDSGDFIQSKLLSNHTHYSPTDPDARISTKPGKPRNLNYLGQLSVDTSHHVITGGCADYADKKDSQCLEKIADQVIENLKENSLKINELLSDTAYSSGEVLHYLDEKEINGWIPNLGQYKPDREGFIYNKELDRYECQRGNKAILPFKGIRNRDGEYQYKQYLSSESACKNCPIKKECCGEKTKYKRITHSIHKELYDRMHKKRIDNKAYAQRMSRLRSSTVEPVLGTLINFLNMKRVNTRGIDLANKHVLMASLTYNLKKYLKFIAKERLSKTMSMTAKVQTTLSSCFFPLFRQIRLIFRILDFMFSGIENSCQKCNPLLERSF
jgi:transposase